MEEVDESQVNARIFAERVKRKWSQERLRQEAEKLGQKLHQTGISKIEAGTRKVTITEAVTFSRVYGMTLNELVFGVKEVVIDHEITARRLAKVVFENYLDGAGYVRPSATTFMDS
jgi:transcriptional regulator with XRE-family HTH domain